MGFYFRKSVKFGPVRLNLSKSGVGVSGGVKGFRVSTGSRGTYLNAGTNGLYLRKRLDKGGTHAHVTTVVIITLFVFVPLVFVFIGVVALFSPVLAVSLAVIAVFLAAITAFGAILSFFNKVETTPTEAVQKQTVTAIPIKLDDNPEKALVDALKVFVREGNVSMRVLQRDLNVSLEDAVRLISELEKIGLIAVTDAYLGHGSTQFVLLKRAYAVANVLDASNYTCCLEEFKLQPPHVVLGIHPSASLSEKMSAYKQKKASYDPTKMQQLSPACVP